MPDRAAATPTDKKSFMRALLAQTKDFRGKPVPITPFADWDYYYINEKLEWIPDVGAPADFSAVTAPEGFVTDLASIPPALWPVLPPTGRYAYPAIIHDYLYWFQPCSRDQADMVLKLAMQDMVEVDPGFGTSC